MHVAAHSARPNILAVENEPGMGGGGGISLRFIVFISPGQLDIPAPCRRCSVSRQAFANDGFQVGFDRTPLDVRPGSRRP
jgi:hypothetical protein